MCKSEALLLFAWTTLITSWMISSLLFLPALLYPKCAVLCLVAQSCPALCYPMGCSLPGFSVHRILQARILEWAAISLSRGSSQPRDQTQVSCIEGRFFTIWATMEAQKLPNCFPEGPVLFYIFTSSVEVSCFSASSLAVGGVAFLF